MANRRQRCLSRRSFLVLGATATGAYLLPACATPAQPAATNAPTKAPEVKATAQATAPAPAATTVPTQAPAVATKAAGPKRGGTFTFARTSGITEFNPMSLLAGHYAYLRSIYNTLAHYDTSLNLQPELAEKWDFSADGKTLTLKLREGVKFHSGREFTAADVKATVDFTVGDDKSTMRELYKTVKQVDTPDKYTAVLRFDSLNPSAFDILDTLFIIDKDSLANRAQVAVGTGPFNLDKYVPNDRLELVANKDYWDKGKPYVDKVVVRDIPDVGTMAINLESGAVDCIWQPTYIDLARLKGSGGKFVVDLGAPGALHYNLTVNVKADPFKDKRVRQAMAWAVDRARFCKTALQGLVAPTCLMWPTSSWGYFKDLEGKVGYDLEKAKGLLKQAGLEKGFETEILYSSKTGYGRIELGGIIQADLKKLNINAKLTDLEPAQYNARMNKGDILMLIMTYGRAGRDPGTLVTAARAWYTEREGAWHHFESDTYEQLRKELQGTLDRDKRKAAARKIQELALDEAFVNPVCPYPAPWAYAGYVKGFGYDFDNSPLTAEIWLDK
ncbi:MAG: ABC transporter substrate-binding protein [Chloroflexi bacterium]|nr:ABC transporter substrate-binding protein [Chloroflexota bacterium]